MKITSHKVATYKLQELADNAHNYYAVHYACENYYKSESTTPRIVAIAICNLDSGHVRCFSVHLEAEKQGVVVSAIKNNYAKLEASMLKDFFDFVKSATAYNFIRWDVDSEFFGFSALEHRYKFLIGESPFVLPDSRKISLSKWLLRKYGDNYSKSNRLSNLLDNNSSIKGAAIHGEKEAEAFENDEYGKILQSLVAKVESFGKIVELAVDDKLMTNSTWKDIYGDDIRGFLKYLTSEWWGVLIVSVASGLIGSLIVKLLGL